MTNDLLSSVELAFASYADLLNGDTADQRLSLERADLTRTQAEIFAERYPTVVAQFGDPSGLSATVFKDKVNNLAVCIRGTQLDLNDLRTDADIASFGAAYEQIVAMANWWRSVSSPPGQSVQQFRLATHAAETVPAGSVVLHEDGPSIVVLEDAPSIQAASGSENISAQLAADSDRRVDVTGHSLGGHLAMAFSSLFASQTAQVTVFNSPGFINDSTNRAFFARLGGTIPASTSIRNVVADEALVGQQPFKAFAGLWSRPGVRIDIPIENQWNTDEPDPILTLNHGVSPLADSLAVYSLLADLSPELSAAAYKVILNQASQGTAAGLERVVDTLETLLGVNSDLLPSGRRNREQLYRAIYDLRQRPEYIAKIGLLDIAPTPDVASFLLERANQDGVEGLAYRYTLNSLAPFMLTGSEAASIYAAHNANHELDRYDPAARTGSLTQEWLQDRATFLERKLYISGLDRNRNYEDPTLLALGVTPNPPDERGRAYQQEARHYEDRGSGFVASTGGNLSALQLYVFGDSLANSIVAPAAGREDHLYGDAGSDFLVGRYADDYLEGGPGLDIYQYNALRGLFGTLKNDGEDVIRDTDGSGILRYTFRQSGSAAKVESTPIAGVGVKVSATEWRSPDGKFTYRQEAEGLIVAINSDAGGSVHVRDFDYAQAIQGSYLGIRLVDNLSPPETIGNVFTGDLEYFDANPSESGVQTQLDEFGNVVRDESRQQIDREDLFLGSVNEVDRFQTGGGNDAVYGDGLPGDLLGATDWIDLGPGRDYASGGAGNDLLEGGSGGVWIHADAAGGTIAESGGDVLQGGVADDVLFGEARTTLSAAILAGETEAATGEKGDFLSGGAGADWLVAGAGNDLLFGGGAADIIVAGGGDDTISSDQGFETLSLFWQATRTKIVVPGQRNGYVSDYSDNLTLADASAAAADAIYGGAGEDWIFSGSGDDFAAGGTGDDAIFGMEGADALTGGIGDDELSGDLGHGALPDVSRWGDYLEGGEGSDILYGDWGDDILIGGPGDDLLYGGSGPGQFGGHGKDVYVFDRGDGRDQIIDRYDYAEPYAVASVLVFGEGFDPATLTIRAGSMILDFGDGDSVELTEFDHNDPHAPPAFESLNFADGTVLTFMDVLDRGFDIVGTEDDDDGGPQPVIVGTAYGDNMRGLGGDDELQGRRGNDLLDGGDGQDRLFGMEGDDTIVGARGMDAVVGGDGADTLSGGAGSDGLWGESGNDLLDGGAGADILIGGSGDDTYLFGEGDTAFDFDGATTIAFRAGIAASAVALRLQFANTLPTYVVELDGAASDNDRMFIQLSSEAQLAAFEFANGTVLHHDELLRETWVQPHTVAGSAADDVLDGYAGIDTLLGGDGNDTLIGRRGDDRLEGGRGADTLSGGAGDDWLDGGDGSDLYVISRGADADVIWETNTSGADVLRLTDVASAEVSLARRANGDLVLTIASGGSVTVAAQYDSPSNGIERIEFADAVLRVRTDLDALAVGPIEGTTGNDLLVGTSFDDMLLGRAGDDVLQGGAGEDVLEGGEGIDTYILGGEPGYDTLIEPATEPNAVRLAAGIEFDDIRASRRADDLLLSVRGVTGGVIIPAYYAGSVNWTVSSDAEASISVSALLDHIESITPPDTPSEVDAAYLDAVGLQYAIYLQSFGANGGVVVNEQPAADDVIIHRDAPYGETGASPTYFLNLARVTGGGSANLLDMQGVALADAGGGDDVIRSHWSGFRNGLTSTSIGSHLYGNAGNDWIEGTDDADWILGGEGDDYLAGAEGDDKYIVFASETGVDLIDETIDEVIFPGGYNTFSFPRQGTDALELADVRFVDAVFNVGQFDSTPLVPAGQGRIYPTLDISWNAAGTVRLILPPLQGTPYSHGVEMVRFADGTTLSQGQILAEINPPTSGTAGDQATIDGTPAADELRVLSNERSSVNGLGGDDVLFGGSENDFLNGGDGDDMVFGLQGDDVLHGGRGNDSLIGYFGNDVYLFERGDGRDQVSDTDGYLRFENNTDVLRFGAGIAPTDVGVTQDGFSLYLVLLGSEDRVALTAAVSDQPPGAGVNRVEFADGTAWLLDELVARAGVIAESPFDDLIYGASRDDVVEGGAGDDQLGGLGGNDILRGQDGADYLEEWNSAEVDAGRNLIDAGEGNDYVYEEGSTLVIGGAGDDRIDHYGEHGIVAFNAGDGADTVYVAGSLTISLGGGIAAADLVLAESGNDLILVAGADTLRLSREFEPDLRAWPDMRLQFVGTDIRTYDLDGAFAAFYAVQTAYPDLQVPLADLLSQYVLDAGPNQAWGGDIAYAYARRELDSALTDSDVQQTLADPDFGLQPQFVLKAPGTPISGGDDGAVIAGTLAGEEIVGGSGGDWISGGGGDDVLTGGMGDDYLTGGLGADTYVYLIGDGVDTISDPSTGEGNTVQFGAGITPEMIVLDLGSLLLHIGGGGGALHLTSFDPQAPFGARDIDAYRFADGALLTHEALIARGFDLSGSELADVITGTATTDRIRGGRGDDTLAGGLGSDIYEYDVGDGADVIREASDLSSVDVLQFGSGVDAADIAVLRSGDDLAITLPTNGDMVTVAQWYLTPGTLEGVGFADGTLFGATELEARTAVNQPPVLLMPMPDQATREGSAFSYSIDAGTFSDPNPGDGLTLSASLADGTALPEWLRFSGGQFRGTAGSADGGDYVIRVIASDRVGESVDANFHLAVNDSLAEGARLIGTGANDVLNGIAASEFLDGRNGADRLLGGGGDDVLQFFADDRVRGKNRSHDWFDGGPGFDTLLGTPEHDAILLNASDRNPRLTAIEYIAAGDGNDLVDFRDGDLRYGGVLLDGGNGNDVLRSSNGQDVLLGGDGNDELSGGAGTDVYVHRLRDGNDVIEEAGVANELDVLRFAAGITLDMVRTRRRGNDLVLDVAGRNGSVTVKGWFASDAARIELVQFADGTVWGEDTLRKLVCEVPGGDAGGPDLRAGESKVIGRPSAEGFEHHDRREHGHSDGVANWRPTEDFRFDFEAIVRALQRPDGSQPQSSPEDIARQWDAVRRHAIALTFESDESTFEGASGWWHAAISLLGTNGFGFEASIGAPRGPENLKTLAGLQEGFHRL